MNVSEIDQLESLLVEILPVVEIRRGQTETWDLGQYRQGLQRYRSVYDPHLRGNLATFRQLVAEPSVERKLTDFATVQLAPYIRDGLIHSATYALFGGLVSGSPVGDVVRNLIRRAIVDGPRQAAQAFHEAVTGSSVVVHRYYLLSGFRIDEPIEVFDGITLLPIPDDDSVLPPFVPMLASIPDDHQRFGVQHLLGRTVVRAEMEISPVFHRPELSYTFDSTPADHFRMKLRSNEISDLDLVQFYEALSLASRRSVRAEMTWSALPDYEIFDCSSVFSLGGNGFSAIEPVVHLEHPAELTVARLDTIKTLYRALQDLPTDEFNKLRIPIDRWMKSMEERLPEDQIIDLAIALESLYVPGSNTEVGLRLALNAAWHLGMSKPERADYLKFFRLLYGARSNVVHTGRLSARTARSIDLADVVARGQSLCWQGITSIIEAGAIPQWEELILGPDSQ